MEHLHFATMEYSCPPTTAESLVWLEELRLQSAVLEQKEVRLLADVTHRLEIIKRMAKDRESVHIARDQLLLDVLRAIATGQCKDYPPEEFAAEALEVEDLELELWYA